MGLTLAIELGLVGFGFGRRDLLEFELRLGVVAVLFMPALLSARLRKMREELAEAAMVLKGRW